MQQANHLPTEKASRWSKLVDRIEVSPAQLDGYGETMKRDMCEFRDDCEFNHDRAA